MAQEYKKTIEVRQDCKQCGKDIVNARFRTFCCATCRVNWHNKDRQPYQTEWKRKTRKSRKDLNSY